MSVQKEESQAPTAAAAQSVSTNEQAISDAEKVGIFYKPRKKKNKDSLRELWLAYGMVILGLIITAVAYCRGYFADPLDFTMQAWLFSGWGFVGLCVGLNVGFLNSDRKNLWTSSDLVWISLALVSIGSLLAPVEERIVENRMETAAVFSRFHHEALISKATTGVQLGCTAGIGEPQCRQWKEFRDLINTDFEKDNAVAVVAEGLQLVDAHPVTKELRESLKSSAKALEGSFIEGQRIAQENRDVNIPWVYFSLALFIIALGARGGKTGADFAKNRKERKKERILEKLAKGTRDDWR